MFFEDLSSVWPHSPSFSLPWQGSPVGDTTNPKLCGLGTGGNSLSSPWCVVPNLWQHQGQQGQQGQPSQPPQPCSTGCTTKEVEAH